MNRNRLLIDDSTANVMGLLLPADPNAPIAAGQRDFDDRPRQTPDPALEGQYRTYKD